MTKRHVSGLHKSFWKNLSDNIKLSKGQLSKIVQLKGSKLISDLSKLAIEYIVKGKENIVKIKDNSGEVKNLLKFIASKEINKAS